MDWLRSEDLKEEKVVTTSNFIIARGQLRRSFPLSYRPHHQPANPSGHKPAATLRGLC